MLNETLEDKCISLITKISCLLVYYNFELFPLHETLFQNSKKLFYRGDLKDLQLVFYHLHSIEQRLKNDIVNYHEKQKSIKLLQQYGQGRPG